MENIQIEFYPDTHTYIVDGEEAKISVTALVDKQVTKTEWFAIDPAILQRAADRGTDVHADLEYIVGKGTEPRTEEGKNFVEYIKSNNWIIEEPLTEFKLALKYEKVINNRKYSFILTGTADLICKLNGKYAIIDHKTTSVVHEESVRWQMSLLDYMARQINGYSINGVPFNYTPAEEFYCFHFNKQAKFTPVKLPKISDVEIERLLAAEAMNEEYHPTVADILTPRQQQELTDIQKRLTALAAAKAALEQQEAVLRREMEQAFEAHPDTKRVDFGTIAVSYTAPTTKQIFNTTKFKEDHPDLYKQYLTTSNVKGSVTITLSKEIKQHIEAKAPEIPLLQPPAPVKRKNTKKGFFV